MNNQNGKGQKRPECIQGITCEVSNCYFNDTNSHDCHAPSIKVGPQYAVNTGDTLCATFQNK